MTLHKSQEPALYEWRDEITAHKLKASRPDSSIERSEVLRSITKKSENTMAKNEEQRRHALSAMKKPSESGITVFKNIMDQELSSPEGAATNRTRNAKKLQTTSKRTSERNHSRQACSGCVVA